LPVSSPWHPDGLANSSGEVGRNYMRHLTASVYARFPRPVRMHRGETVAVANLFVSDGSVFTTGAAANPTLTIVALAIRQAEHIGERVRTGTL
jgi:choline dehydrogenase-like flavoprotein